MAVTVVPHAIINNKSQLQYRCPRYLSNLKFEVLLKWKLNVSDRCRSVEARHPSAQTIVKEHINRPNYDKKCVAFWKPMVNAIKNGDLQDAKAELKSWCHLVLRASSASRPELRFTAPQDLVAVIKGAQSILPAKRWRVVLHIHEKAASKGRGQWRASLPKGCELKFATPYDGPQDPRNNDGWAHLFLVADPKAEREIKDSKFSPYRLDTKALVYVAYILMVILATEEDLVRLAQHTNLQN